jgi:hypothetical protein
MSSHSSVFVTFIGASFTATPALPLKGCLNVYSWGITDDMDWWVECNSTSHNH